MKKKYAAYEKNDGFKATTFDFRFISENTGCDFEFPRCFECENYNHCTVDTQISCHSVPYENIISVEEYTI